MCLSPQASPPAATATARTQMPADWSYRPFHARSPDYDVRSRLDGPASASPVSVIVASSLIRRDPLSSHVAGTRRVCCGKHGATQSLRLKPAGVISAMHPAGRGGVAIAHAQHLDVPERAIECHMQGVCGIPVVVQPAPSAQRRPPRSPSQRTGGIKRRLQRWAAQANGAEMPTSAC